MLDLINSFFALVAFGLLYGNPVVTFILLALVISFTGLTLTGIIYLCSILYRAIRKLILRSKLRKEDSSMSDKQDKTIQCKDCGKDFVFTVGEQEFYEQHQFSDPVRCKSCREARKANHNN